MAETVLVTGAGGEMGHALIPELARRGDRIVALDLRPVPGELAAHCREFAEGSILDDALLDRIWAANRFDRVFHLAALLSSSAERDPGLAHRVNVDGTLGLLRRCRSRSGAAVRFFFPSSIAVYGLPGAAVKDRQGRVKEHEWLVPTGMYGCNKLYCELIGSYLARAGADGGGSVDFRSIRFPGLISAETLPTGGTTDYAPEMIHAAAAGREYECFVAASTRLPFMTMPDAVAALLRLADVEPSRRTARVYNIRGFSASARELREATLRHFPDARIAFRARPEKQTIVDSWPADVDDDAARRDWGLAPRHDLDACMADYLVPAIRSAAADR